MSLYWLIFTAIFVLLFFLRRDLRREMLYSGLLSLPILLIKPLISADFLSIANQNGGLLSFLWERVAVGFSLGAIASVVYETFFHKVITPQKHPHRHKLIYLAIGPVIFALLLLFNFSFVFSVILALLADIIVIAIMRHDLIWDMIFSGFCMSLLYLIIFQIVYYAFPGDLKDFWFTEMSNLVIFSLPAEEVIAVALFGALFGPLYVAIKDLREK